MNIGFFIAIVYFVLVTVNGEENSEPTMSIVGWRVFLHNVRFNPASLTQQTGCCLTSCNTIYYTLILSYELSTRANYLKDVIYSTVFVEGQEIYYFYSVVDMPPDKFNQATPVVFNLNVFCENNNDLQENFNVMDLEFYPFDGSAFNGLDGDKKKMKVSFGIKGNCPGRAGIRCSVPCYENEIKYCDEYTGETYCKNKRFGQNCELEISACNSNPCVNGICEVAGAGFICHCSEGFSGVQCDILACTESNCKNGLCQGIKKCNCFDGYVGVNCDKLTPSSLYCNGRGFAKKTTDDSNYECQCYKDSTGSMCEYSCVPSCKNGGICVTRMNMGFCECVKSYIGKSCELEVGQGVCESIQCQNEGECHEVGANSFMCQCSDLWYGSYCELSVCHTDYCYHGTCMDNYGCLCYDGYSGKRCEYIDDQTYAECKNGGTKASDLGFLRCVCNEKQFTGSFCEYKCHKSCVNGECVWEDSVIKCACDVGYIGEDCSVKRTTSICDTHPCFNDGECIGLIGEEFECKCSEHWTGKLCEQSTCKKSACFKGICVDGVGCTCIKGYNGTMCNVPQCPSDNSVCTKSEQCKISSSRLYCNCDTTKYFGSKCEFECNPACSENGKCSIAEGELKCVCFANYIGPTCEQLIDDPRYLYIIYGCSAAIVLLIICISVLIFFILKHKLRFTSQAMRNALFDASGILGIKRENKKKNVDDTYGSSGQKSWAISSK